MSDVDLLADNPQLLVLAGGIVILAALVMAVVLNRAVTQPPPAALITALSMLTLFAIAGGMATNNDEAWTIAAAGVGALAGSVTSLFHGDHSADHDNPKPPVPPPAPPFDGYDDHV